MSRLEKHIKQIRGISYSPDDISDVPVMDFLPILKANNIQDGSLKTDNLIYIHKSKIKPEQLIKKGDILIAASSGSKDIVGKSVFFDEDFDGSFGAFCKVIRPAITIYPKFVSVFFKTPEYKRHIRKVIQGANINNLRTEDINSLKIPLFAFADQIKIAQVLTQAEKLITQRKESIALLDEYLKSTFLEMFGDPVKNEKGWELLKLGEVISIKHGFAFSSEYFKSSGEFVLLTPGNYYESGGYRDRGEKQKYFTGEFPSDYLLNKGDLLIAMTEQADGLLGSAIIIPESNKFLHNQRLGLIQFDPNRLNTRFLFYLFNFNAIRFLIHAKATGIKVRHTSPSRIQEIAVGIPPITVQTQFAQIVEKTENLKSHYLNSLRELEQLFGSLSQGAFKGELDLSRIEVTEEAYQTSDTPPSPTPPKPEKIKKERPRVLAEEKVATSIWLSNRKKGKTGKVSFNPVEGNAVLRTEFSKQDKGFHYQAFEAFLKKEDFIYEYEQIKDFLFEKLGQQELLQYYATQKWMEEHYRPETSPYQDDFSGDGHIWLVINKKVLP